MAHIHDPNYNFSQHRIIKSKTGILDVTLISVEISPFALISETNNEDDEITKHNNNKKK